MQFSSNLGSTLYPLRQHEQQFAICTVSSMGITMTTTRLTPKANTNNTQPACDNDSATNTHSTRNDSNMMTQDKRTIPSDKLQNDRNNNKGSYVTWSIDTHEIDNQYCKDYDNMCRQIENKVRNTILHRDKYTRP